MARRRIWKNKPEAVKRRRAEQARSRGKTAPSDPPAVMAAYENLSPIGKAAVDNIAKTTGMSRRRILQV